MNAHTARYHHACTTPGSTSPRPRPLPTAARSHRQYVIPNQPNHHSHQHALVTQPPPGFTERSMPRPPSRRSPAHQGKAIEVPRHHARSSVQFVARTQNNCSSTQKNKNTVPQQPLPSILNNNTVPLSVNIRRSPAFHTPQNIQKFTAYYHSLRLIQGVPTTHANGSTPPTAQGNGTNKSRQERIYTPPCHHVRHTSQHNGFPLPACSYSFTVHAWQWHHRHSVCRLHLHSTEKNSLFPAPAPPSPAHAHTNLLPLNIVTNRPATCQSIGNNMPSGRFVCHRSPATSPLHTIVRHHCSVNTPHSHNIFIISSSFTPFLRHISLLIFLHFHLPPPPVLSPFLLFQACFTYFCLLLDYFH